MQTSSTMRRLFGWLVLVSIWLAPVLAREWTDSTGKFRVQADLVAVRGENVILEREDGKILTIPIERLSVADREFLKSPPAPAPEAPTPASRPAAAAPAVAPRGDGPKLAQRTQQILRTACYRCHGEDGTSEGGFNFAINLGKLSRTLARPGDVAQSQLWARISARDDSVMPPVGESPRLSEEDLATVKAWIEAGSPALPSTESRPFITNEQVMDAILANVRAQPERSRRFMRYFTLTHLYNAGVSEDELQTYRNAFAKLLNSLSWNTDLVSPQPIDAARTVFGIDMRDVHWNGEIWQSIEEANPYYLQLTSPSALACYDETQSEMPYVRIDWFVFAASKPPLYHSVLNLPDSDSALEELLRINVAANIDQEQAIRAAFNRSGVSQHNRLIEWHKSPYGSYWKSYDFGGSTGRQNLFQYPLGPASDGDTFQHDGGEILFTLPNGLQGYLLVDGSGQRIDQGPTSIVSDPKRPDKTVTNGVSCMSCHYTGVIPKRDEVGGAVRANRGAFDEADDILAIYREPEELDRIFERDAQRFAGTLKKLGIASLSRSGEPVSAMAARFEQEVDLAYVACEFGLTAPDFEQRLNKAEVVARAFSPLKIPGGTIKRDVLKSMFADAAVDLKLTSSANASRIASLPRAATERAPRAAPPMSTGKSNAGKNNAGVVHASFSDLTWGVQSLAFSPDGRLLAAGKPERA
ncbi:MAG: c-type cytochrome domain-containing protein, partial [Pirellulaceae bacterium]